MGQFSLAAVLIVALPDHVLASMARDDLLTLTQAMRQMAGRPETDAAIAKLSRVLTVVRSNERFVAVAPALQAVQSSHREPEARTVSRMGR